MTEEKSNPSRRDQTEASDPAEGDESVSRTDYHRPLTSGPSDDVLFELRVGLDRLDTVFAEESASPSLDALARTLKAAAERSRLKRRRERRLFGVISLAVIALSMLAAVTSPVLYWSLQGLVPVAALLAVIWRAGRRRRTEWK